MNIGNYFYKEYYNGIYWEYVFGNENKNNQSEINENNEKITNARKVDIPQVISDITSIEAKILYPGLITGVGLVHDSKGLVGSFNLGMHFDYTFGMPIVYGSSVKGVLRTYFKDFFDMQGFGEEKVDDLFEDIFNGRVRDITNDKRDANGKLIKAYKYKSIYKRDIFFDAVITKEYVDHRGGKHILEDDAITPHRDDPLKEPTPISMLKIAPGCTLEFRFLLHDSVVSGETCEIKDKKRIFEEILKTVGVGAKTNVGYGQLEILESNKKE